MVIPAANWFMLCLVLEYSHAIREVRHFALSSIQQHVTYFYSVYSSVQYSMNVKH